MQDDSREMEEKLLRALLLPPDPSEEPTEAELEEALDFELQKDEKEMDVELIDFCARRLCEMHGLKVGEELPPRRRPSRKAPTGRRGTMLRWGRRLAVAAAALVVLVVAAEGIARRSALKSYSSEDGEQHIVNYYGHTQGLVSGADADPAVREEGVERQSLNVQSIEEAENFLGYAIPWPSYLPDGLTSVLFEAGAYWIRDDVSALYSDGGDRQVSISMDRMYSVSVSSTSYEENGPGRTIRLDNGQEVYLSMNVDRYWGLITDGKTKYYISVKGYDEETLIRIFNSIE